ncbi:MAG: PepSY domain-containing protein [Paraclostridium bifermentans]|uniref:PepSY domain-containing protein n=1 Tax=Paraclostridium bifermentans TaxID=1490 RepID=UPI00165262DE|nr:PepSY domain-containing protein [Paraclostridium bifermentans]MBS6509144.1 PepSY domain-containing protein [Paraclostridium bifermentans]MDU3335615.1 PepSY domain-containing protein [Paraclostridium bifermentans]
MKKEDVINKIANLKGYKGKFKKFAVLTISGAIGLSVLGTGAAYAYVKSNENYSQAQLEKVALKQIPGEVVGVKKDLDDDNMSVVYEFKIKDKNNMLNEIELDSKTGAIIDMENHNEKDDKDYDSDDEKSYNYNEIKSKSKYSEEELKNIALKKVQGEVIGVDKEIDDDSMSIVYEFKIKDKNNIIKEVEVDSVTGEVVDIENYDSTSDKKSETIDDENAKQDVSNMD